MRQKNTKIYSVIEVNSLFIFCVEKDEDVHDHHYLSLSKCVSTVDRQVGDLESRTFLEYYVAVDAGKIRQINGQIPRTS